eukprot:767688-Hanusia_phi.AAC.8
MPGPGTRRPGQPGCRYPNPTVSACVRQFDSFRTSPIVPELPAPDSIIKDCKAFKLQTLQGYQKDWSRYC